MFSFPSKLGALNLHNYESTSSTKLSKLASIRLSLLNGFYSEQWY